MTTTTMNAGPLTKEQLAALRGADRVAFHHRADGTGLVCCIKRVKRPGPFGGEYDREFSFEVASQVQMYGRDEAYSPDARPRCFALVHRFEDHWHTVADSLRPGDVLTLRWLGNVGNDYEKQSVTHLEGHQGRRLYRDELKLSARRGEGKRARWLVWRVETSVCPDNTARMVKPNG